MDINTFEQEAEKSLLFTSPVLGKDLQRFLNEKAGFIQQLAQQALDEKVEHIYWVGAGNSRVNLLSGKELLDQFTDISSDCYLSYEFIWRNPQKLNKNSWVFLASFSGATEDTVAALRFAKEKGAKTIAFVDKKDSLMGKEADVVIDYSSKALYILPLAGTYLFALEAARLSGNEEVKPIIDQLYQLPDFLTALDQSGRPKALEQAQEFENQDLIYTLGCGPLYGLSYKFGLTVFMENMRVNGSFIETTEFRHGPAEMLDSHKPAFIIIAGADESRPVTERVMALLKQRECPMLIFDAKEYDFHPLLAPFTLMIPLQLFSIYSAYLRGIYDLDERVLMGHGIMGKGAGVTWP